MSRILCNKFGGIREITPAFGSNIITAQDMQNVELYFTGINEGVGIRTQKGNTNISASLIPAEEMIVNIFESVQNQVTYFFIHTVSSTEGKVYLFNGTTVVEKISGLSVTDVSEGVDFSQGYRDLFIFANGVDDLHYIEMGATPESGTISAEDSEEREIKGLGLTNYSGRIWTFVDNRLHYCVTSNVFDWSTSDISIKTSAGYIEFPKKITAICPYLSSIAVFFSDSSVIVTGTYPFEATEDSPGGCAGYNSLVFHGTDLYFYDDSKKGIFSFQQVILGNKTLGNNIALNIAKTLNSLDRSKLNQIKMISVNYDDRNEVWLILPTTDTHSTILIYDDRTGEWVKRVSQKITCAKMINNQLYSATSNKILREYQGNNFDGEFIASYYKTSAYNENSFNTLKGFWAPPRISLNAADNIFWVKYRKDLKVFDDIKDKKISAEYKNYHVWNVSDWNTMYWYSSSAVSIICNLPKPSVFKVLEIDFYTKELGEGFSIQNIEFSNIQIIQS